MKTTSRRHYRRAPVDPWSAHNLRLLNAACTGFLLKNKCHVEHGFNYGAPNPRKKK